MWSLSLHVHAILIWSLCQGFLASVLLTFGAEPCFLLPDSVLYSMTSPHWRLMAALPSLPHTVTVQCISTHCHMSWGKFAPRLRTISLAQPRFLSMAPSFPENERGSSQWFQGLGPETFWLLPESFSQSNSHTNPDWKRGKTVLSLKEKRQRICGWP